MSLYDSIRCEYPLPNPAFQDEEFQTKDLERSLGRYTITRDGRLLRHVRKSSDLFARPKRLDTTAGPAGMEEVPHHGDLHIYTSTVTGELVEYRVRFTEGRVAWIRPEASAIAPGATPSLAELVETQERLEQGWVATEDALLRQLERLDPEVAAQAIYVFSDRADAAHWLTRPHPELDYVTPLRAVAEGRRREVLDILMRLFHGISA